MLKNLTDREFVMMILDERASDCTNQYAPLYQRLMATRMRVQKDIKALPTKGYLKEN
jgi:hypothetical protein